MIRVWRDHPVLRRRKFFQGRRIRGADVIDIAWIDPSGREMTDETWNSPDVRCLGVRLNGDAINEVNERGERIVGETLVIMFNAGEEAVPFSLPETGPTERWETLDRHRRPVFAGPMADGEGSLPAAAALHDGAAARLARAGLAESGGVGTDGSVLTVGGRQSAVGSQSRVGSRQSVGVTVTVESRIVRSESSEPRTSGTFRTFGTPGTLEPLEPWNLEPDILTLTCPT